MSYEIDFIGIEAETKDADALCLRWKNDDDSNTIGVYDAGFKAHGEKVVELLSEYYFKDNNKKIDFLICSHSDQDHVSGMSDIINNYDVKALYVNLPWLYADELYERVKDGRITVQSLEKRLKEKYSYIAELEKLALEKKIPVYSAFQGDVIEGRLTLLSPSKEFYLDLLAESDKTPPMDTLSMSEKLFEAVMKVRNFIEDKWFDEKLRENVSTSAENEMSIVVLGRMNSESFLLTGDAGIRALRESIDYASSISVSLKDDVALYQVPHHGSRHNVSPSILDDLVGKKLSEGTIGHRSAIVCTGAKTDSPKKMVCNAFITRGVKVFQAKGKIICHSRNMSERVGWGPVSATSFSPDVEEWS